MAKQGEHGIAWTDETWNPLRGCSRVSAGCRHCYAEAMAARFSGPGQPYEGLAIMKSDGPHWTGKVVLAEDKLTEPLHWRKPRRVFVNSMSDLFHESVPDEWIDRIFAVMAHPAASRHTFQVLTKRPKRMLHYMTHGARGRIEGLLLPMITGEEGAYSLRDSWPLPNVWPGVSVENQQTADERIAELQQTLAAVRFISYEPALAAVDFSQLLKGIHWLICGGESGPSARPFDVAWARQTIAQCMAAGVACFVKQLGSHPHDGLRCLAQWMDGCGAQRWSRRDALRDRKGGDIAEWPSDLRVREWPKGAGDETE